MYLALRSLKSYLRAFTDLIYVRTCPGCGAAMLRAEKFICLGCQVDLPLNPFFHSSENEIKAVFSGRLPLRTANTLLYFTKNGIAQHLLHALKYQDREDIGEFLGEMLGAELVKTDCKPDIILPVPLHKSKQKQRGYNQCHSIALGLQRELGGAITFDAVERSVANPSQTKLNRAKRWDNVDGIFSLQKPQLLANKHVLLIDDTLTTGATLESCGQTILQAENVAISIATLAYAK